MLKGLLSVMVAIVMLGSGINAPLKDNFAAKTNIPVTYEKCATYYDGLIITEDEIAIEYRNKELDKSDEERILMVTINTNNTLEDTTDDYIVSYDDITDQESSK